MPARKLVSPSTKDHPSAAQGRRDQLARINRLHAALKATLQPQDLLSIILACLVSEEGLGFHRAFAFSYDERADAFRGVQAMGPANRQERKQLLAALAAESRALSRRAARMEKGEINLGEGVGGLRQHAFWIDLIQRYPPDNPLDRQTRVIETECQHCKERGSRSCLRQAGEAATGHNQPLAMELQGPCLKDLLRQPAIGGALRTKKGLRGVIVADMAFGPEKTIGQEQRGLFQWFIGHASSALENCELYSDLEQAYTQLQEMDTVKGNFLSVVSHELRSPLTAISGFTEVLLSPRAGVTSEEHRGLLLRIRRQSAHLARIVDDLLEMAEATLSPGATLSLDSVDPLAALMNVLRRLEGRRTAKSVLIEPIVEGRIPQILANEMGLERTLYHLLDNAVKFSPHNGQVGVAFQAKSGRVRIEIRDRGIGIAKGHLKRVFEMFYQVDNRLSRGYEGLGIGLTLTKRLLEAMGGSIAVESHLGQGSCFAMEFPVAPGEDERDVS